MNPFARIVAARDDATDRHSTHNIWDWVVESGAERCPVWRNRLATRYMGFIREKPLVVHERVEVRASRRPRCSACATAAFRRNIRLD